MLNSKLFISVTVGALLSKSLSVLNMEILLPYIVHCETLYMKIFSSK